MKDQRKAEEIAANRYQLIAPLLEPGMGSSEAAEKRRRIAAENGLSERTLRRYIAAYRKHHFKGLMPAGRKGSSGQPDWMEKRWTMRSFFGVRCHQGVLRRLSRRSSGKGLWSRVC